MSKNLVIQSHAANPGVGGTPCDSNRVGYGHPPKHSQFKPGQSGNPNGRPKGRRSLRADWAAALCALMPDGEKTKWQTMAENLANAGVADIAIALKIVPLAISTLKDDIEDEGELTPQQAQLVKNFEDRQASTESATQSHDASTETTAPSEDGGRS